MTLEEELPNSTTRKIPVSACLANCDEKTQAISDLKTGQKVRLQGAYNSSGRFFVSQLLPLVQNQFSDLELKEAKNNRQSSKGPGLSEKTKPSSANKAVSTAVPESSDVSKTSPANPNTTSPLTSEQIKKFKKQFEQQEFLSTSKQRGLSSKQCREEAIIILSTVTQAELQQAREILQRNGVDIRLIFPPSAFIARVPANLIDWLKELDFLEEVSYTKLDLGNFSAYEDSTLAAIKLWNKRLEEEAGPEGGKDEKRRSEKEKFFAEPFKDSLISAPDLPKTKEGRGKKDKEYQLRWNKRKPQIEKQERAKKQKWEEKHAKKKKTRSPNNPLIVSAPGEGGITGFGRAASAGFYDTSLYMAGDVAVGIFFDRGTNGDWSAGDIDAAYQEIVDALSIFSSEEPNARITFIFKKEVAADTGLPNPPPYVMPKNPDGSLNMNLTDAQWSEKLAREREYINDLRNVNNTHWAYTLTRYNGEGRAFALLWGPSTAIFDDFRWGYPTRHETMHIFGAMDQYHPDAARSPTDRWGYLNVVNANSQYNDGTGFFGGSWGKPT